MSRRFSRAAYAADVMDMGENEHPRGEHFARTKEFMVLLQELSDSIREHLGDAIAIRAAMERCYDAHSKIGVEHDRSCQGISDIAVVHCPNVPQGEADPWHVFSEFKRIATLLKQL